jgi:membrane associated rhomboid family serine protease
VHPGPNSSNASTLGEDSTSGARQTGFSLRLRLLKTPASLALFSVTFLIFLVQLTVGELGGCDTLLMAGAKNKAAIAAGEVWRLFTPLFLHTCVRHVAVNLLSLFALGPPIERFYGGERLLVIYLASGVGCVAVSILMCPSECVGASGAVLGLVGALLAMMYLNRRVFGRGGILRLFAVSLVALLSVGFGIAEEYDMWGHLGGLLTGLILGLVLGPLFHKKRAESGQIILVDGRPWRHIRLRALVISIAILCLAQALSYLPSL